MRAQTSILAITICAVGLCLAFVSPLRAQVRGAGNSIVSIDQEFPYPKLLVGVGVGTQQEPFERIKQSGALGMVSVDFMPTNHLAIEGSLSKSFAGWSTAASLLFRSDPSRVIWLIGGGPLFGWIPPSSDDDLRERVTFVQAIAGAEVYVTPRVTAYGSAQLNVTATDYGNMWILGGLRLIIFTQSSR